MKFKLNDKVAWTSQAQGCTRSKVGTVVLVVAPGDRPGSMIPGCGFPRRHESYVVEVPSKTGRAKPKLYWPVASGLSRVAVRKQGVEEGSSC